MLSEKIIIAHKKGSTKNESIFDKIKNTLIKYINFAQIN